MTVRIWPFIAIQSVCLVLFMDPSVQATDSTDTRPGGIDKSYGKQTIEANNVFADAIGPQPRIVGGTNAPRNRYPYFVSLLNQYGKHSCGGALVAPDVVMSAAHCNGVKFAQVGRWSLSDDLDGYEEFEIETPLHPHPLYSSEISFSHDVILLKLNRQSTKQPIRVNNIPDLPSTTGGDSLTTMGLGYTQYGQSSSSPQQLQEASLSYVPNMVCERAKDPNAAETYQGLILDDMLCASDDGEDACQGDSGGPLIVKGDTATADILVGIVSWGFGCAHPYFPGVFSRVSYFSEWIKRTICDISSNPPPEYDCGNAVVVSTEENSVPITVILQLDDHPTEISWSVVRKETNTTLVNVIPGTYTMAQAQSQETIFLPAGSINYFKIFDGYGDGLCCDTPGNYRVVLGRNAAGNVLLSGGGNFGYERWHEFEVPMNFKEKTDEPEIDEGQIPLTVVIQLDSFPQEVGWRIDRLDIQIEEVIRLPAGIYNAPDTLIVRTVVLEENELYHFNIYDMSKDGIQGGKVQVFLGTTDIYDFSRLIFESDGNFQAGTDYTFMAGFNPVPTIPPLLPSQAFLTLEIRMDLYPGEISIQLRMADEDASINRKEASSYKIIFFRPPNFYSNRVGETVIEQIPIPEVSPGALRQFVFIIADRYGDGLCCSWVESTETGYTLYNGDQATGRVIVSSKFESLSREIEIFNILDGDLDLGDTDNEHAPEPSFEIKVSITLDVYPDETGFYIEDSLRRRVVDVPPGTYNDQHTIVEEIATLEAGLYTFTILDSFGDGINRDDSFYRLDLEGEASRPPLVTGNGAFASQESRPFLVEGKSANLQLFIRIPADNDPKELGISIFRLDIVESDAMVASQRKGQAENAYELMLLVTEGGLYKVVVESDLQALNGDIFINLGSSNPSVYKGTEYRINLEDTTNPQTWQLKFPAGQLSTELMVGDDLENLTLSLKFDRFPSEVEWILLSNYDDDDATLDEANRRGLKKRKLLAFGPGTMYDESLDGKTLTETINIPRQEGNQSFTLLVTDSGGDGLCCSFGEGGPVELFRGAAEEGHLLFSAPFQGGRLVKAFYFSGKASASSSQTQGFVGVFMVLALGSILF